MADKMRLYAGDEDIDLEELERALTIVRRKMADPAAFPGFLENPEVCNVASLLACKKTLASLLFLLLLLLLSLLPIGVNIIA